MAAKHRVTMGGQPTIPEFVNRLGISLAVIGAQPPQVQREALTMLTQQMTALALRMQAAYSPRPVV